MLGRKERDQLALFITGSLRQLIPDDHVLVRVDAVLDLSWLRAEIADLYCLDNGRPGIDPEVAVRLMLAGFLLGIVHDRRLMREAAVNIAIRWFMGYGLHEPLPDHSSLTRIRQRWGAERFRRIFERTVQACIAARIATGEVVHIDASLIRAHVSWEALAVRHVEAIAEVDAEADREALRDSRQTGKFKKVCVTDPDAPPRAPAGAAQAARLGQAREPALSAPSLAGRGRARRSQDLARPGQGCAARARQHAYPGLPHRCGDQPEAARRRLPGCDPASSGLVIAKEQRESGAPARLTPIRALTHSRRREARACRFFNDPTRQRCQVALNTRDTAALMPSWASEMMSFTPRRPRRARLRRKSVQNVSASEVPIAMPSTSRLPSAFTPTAMVTATETMRPAWRTFRYVASTQTYVVADHHARPPATLGDGGQFAADTPA